MSESLFAFVHVTDTHHRIGDSRLMRFADIINSEKLFPLPDFVIHTGDIINGYEATPALHREAMSGAKEALDKLKPELILTCHNHDTFGEDIRGTIFDEVFGIPHFHSIEKEGFLLTAFSGAAGTEAFWKAWPTDRPQPGGPGERVRLSDMLSILADYFNTHTDKPGLVFSHRGLPVRRPAIDIPPEHLQAYEYIRSGPIIDIFKKVFCETGRNIAHYSGHTHINAHQQFGGVSFVTTASMYDYPCCFRYAEVFEDRIVNQTFGLEGEFGGSFRWGPLTDEDHHTAELYYGGLPREQEFTINFAGSH